MEIENKIPMVEVLLATYNGEKYLREFLDSLANQEGVLINLKVSDDGSRDSTLEILKTYEGRFQEFELFDGPRKGPAENFFSLLKNAGSDFVAFADQDDIWHSDHLIKSISRLKQTIGPALTFSTVREFVSLDSSLMKQWPKNLEMKSIQNIAFQNYARGCTMVLNLDAVNLVNSKTPRFAIMHDWWVLQTIMSCGEVFFSNSPEIKYRIHSDNFTRNKSRPYWTFLRTFVKGQWAPIQQLESLFQSFEESMNESTKHEILELLALTKSPIKGLIFSLTCKQRLRETFASEVKLRMGLPFSFILTRKNSQLI